MTIQKSGLDPQITKDVQTQFQNTLGQQAGLYSGMAGSAPTMTNIGQFSPSELNLQKSVSMQTAGPYNIGGFSENLNPIVAGNLARTYQDTAGQADTMNRQIAERLGNNPANNALIASIQADNRMNAGLSNNAARLGALTQQRGYDVEGANLDLQKSGLDLSRINQNNQALLNAGQFANQASLDERGALERAFGLNADATARNNQFALESYNANQTAQQQSAALQQELLKTLGQGLVSTSPQVQSNFTVDDIKEIMNNPDLMNAMLGQAGTAGLLSAEDIARLTGSSGGNTMQVRPTMQNAQQNQWNTNRNNAVARSFGIY
ncbi:hypothetical protein [Caudoviricetes sp.]|nr:hypothetical protein [Caudoviricetes sp.]